MKKKNPSKVENSPASDEKTLFRHAGELIGTIGAQIALGTAKVVDFVSDEANVMKKVIKKKLNKKAAQKKKVVNKASPKATRKPIKKTAPKKKKARKVVKKSAVNQVRK